MDAPYTLTPGQNLDSSLGFLAYSGIIDNPTAQWWYIGQANRYISPYQMGVRFSLDGAQNISVKSQTPPGQISEIIANELAYITFSDSHLPELTGISAIMRPHYYDRNPIDRLGSFYAITLGAHGLTSRWLYTVPSGKAAYIELLEAFAFIELTGGRAIAQILINGLIILHSMAELVNIGGTLQVFQGGLVAGGQLHLNPGDTIRGQTQYDDLGGVPAPLAAFFVSFKGTEYSI